MEKFRKLTPHDLAFGLGRKATKEELQELLARPEIGPSKPADQVLADLKRNLAAKRMKKAS